MKAKMFVHPSVQEGEKAVNEWLQNNEVNVQYIGQSQSEQGGRFVFIISVFIIQIKRRLFPLSQDDENC